MSENHNAASRAREYLRVSVDRSGRARSLDEQHEENTQAAEREGWALGDPYRDELISASRYSRKVRGGFGDLLADLEAGRFGADVLVLWESSRGSRKVSEWVELIESCERRGVRLHVTTHGRTYDPASGRDRRTLLEDAVDSEYESSKTSTRLRRAAAANAAAGKPHGAVPFGYQRRYDERTRGFVAQEENPTEAPVVRELFARIVAGHSIRGIARDFSERGIEKRSGGPFSAPHLRALLLAEVYAGRRVHVPGRRGGHERRGDARRSDATWPALVSDAEWHTVQRVLSDPARITTRAGRGLHLLSMIARCAECDGPLSVAKRRTGPPGVFEYRCERGHVRLKRDDLDEYAESAMLGWLARPDVYSAVTAAEDGSDEEVAAARDQIGAVRARLNALADAVAAGSVSVTLAARSEPQLLDRLRNAEARERELSTPSTLRGLIEPGPDVTDRWQAAPMSARRQIARILLAPDLLGTLTVRRTGRGARGRAAVPVAERITFRREREGR